MIELVHADLIKLRGRVGLFWTIVALPIVLSVLSAILELAFGEDPGTSPKDFASDVGLGLAFILLIVAVITAARLGSEEHASGTLRYQVLTGTARWRLYASKAIVVLLVCVTMAVLSTLGAVFGALVAADGPGEGVGVGVAIDVFWTVLLRLTVFASIAFGIGGLLRSTGPAIAVAVVLALGGTNIVLLLSLIDEGLDVVAIDFAIDRLTVREFDDDDEIGLTAAIVCALAWTSIPLAAGLLRLQRLEP